MTTQDIKSSKCGCGVVVPIHAENCPRCTWPFRETGWAKTTRRIRRITLDTSCVNQKQGDVYLNQLEVWAAKGLITIERARAMLSELQGEARREKASAMPGHPGLFTLGSSTLGGGDVLAGPQIPTEVLKRVLFPTARPLTENQELDIRHLQELARSGSDCLVTIDTDFINKKVQLAQELGIWVFTPEEMVNHLRRLYGFDRET